MYNNDNDGYVSWFWVLAILVGIFVLVYSWGARADTSPACIGVEEVKEYYIGRGVADIEISPAELSGETAHEFATATGYPNPPAIARLQIFNSSMLEGLAIIAPFDDGECLMSPLGERAVSLSDGAAGLFPADMLAAMALQSGKKVDPRTKM